jgi:uncharacterized SAM-binding protein YcdF (DUF218 family)
MRIVKFIAWPLAAILLLMIILALFLSPNDLSRCDTQPTANQCRAADVIVAISGGNTAARTRKAIELYKQGWAPQIIFSGAAADPTSPSNAATMKRQALAAGVPEKAIWLDEQSKNTSENAKNVAVILAQHNLSDVILVSENYHLRRARLLFEAATQQFTAAVNLATGNINLTAVRTAAPSASPLWWLNPAAWWQMLGELGGIVRFYISGGKV